MAVTNFSPLLGLALPTTGDLSGTWGDVVNQQITDLIDDAIAGTTVLSTDADVTLTTTNGADNQARQAVIRWTANGTVTRNITAPAQSKAYIVINATAGTQSIVIRGAGPTTGVTVPAGRKVLVAWNGSDFVSIAGTQINLATDVTGTLPAANGGTGQSSYATGDLLYASGATTISKLGVGSTGQVLTVSGGVPTWGASSGASANGTMYENSLVVTSNYTLSAGKNALSVGPITINSGVSVTVPSGQRWVIL